MSELIVGGAECSISDIVHVLKSSPELTTLDNRLLEISTSLGLSSEQIKSLRQDILLGKTTLITELDYILAKWVTKNGRDATLRVLIDTFTKFGMKSIAGSLENAFPTSASFLSTQDQKYILRKAPNGVDDFLNGRMEDDVSILIISAINAEFTLLKITKFYPHLQVTNYLEHEMEGQLPEIRVILDCDGDMEKALKNSSAQKRVIITSKEKADLDELAGEKEVKVVEDFIELDDISEPFMKIILERAKKLVNDIPFESLKESLSGALLSDLINDKAKLFKSAIPPPPKNYINRTLETRNIISNDLFQATPSDIFLFRGMQLLELHKLARNHLSDRSTNQLNNLTVKFIILKDPNHFEIICDKSPGSVHLLEKNDRGSLSWIKSKGEISGISKFVDKEQLSLGEDELINLTGGHNQPVLICDSPGMGKSALLSKLARILEGKYQERAVLFLTMTQLVNEIRQEIISKEILESALIKLSCSNKLEMHSLQNKLKMETNEILIELLLDGFDEINSSDDLKAYKMLKLIQSFKSIRLWITSRSHLMQDLENTLGVLGFTIKPFSAEDQLNYFVNYWSIVNGEKKVDCQKLQKFARHLLQSRQSLPWTLLHCLLIGEVYKKDALEFSEIGVIKPLAGCIDCNTISGLYGYLTKRKIDEYLERFGERVNEEKLMALHFRISLRLIFPQHSDLWDEVIDELLNKDEVLQVGIVQFPANSNIPTFIHRTFAEYFVALFIAEWLKSKWIENVTGGEKIIGFFLEEILKVSKTSCLILGMDTVSFIFRHNLICNIVDEKVIDFEEREAHKASFRRAKNIENVNGIVHASANSGFGNILQLLYKQNLLQSRLDFTLAAIAMRNDSTSFEFLMSKGLISLEILDQNQNTLLHAAAAYCKFETVKFITIQKGTPLSAKNKEGSTPLHIAASCKKEKCLDILKLLVGAGTDVFSLDNENRTFLHILAKNDILTPANFHDFAVFLIGEKLSNLFNSKGWENQATPIQWIIGKIEPEEKTLKKLHSSGVDFNYINAFGGSLFTFALLGGRSIKCLLSLIKLGVDPRRVDNNNAGLLHLSCELGNIEAVNLFLENGLDINAVDDSGCTPLHRAVQFNTEKIFELAKLLLDNGADVKAKNFNGLTPLGIIIKREIDEDLKFNLAELFGVNFTLSEDDKSPNEMEVHIPGQGMEVQSPQFKYKDATFASTFSMIKFLIESGANAYAKDKDNLTLLHKLLLSDLCSPSQFEEVTKYLIEKDKADLFNVPGGHTDYTPLQLAMERLDLNEETPELAKLRSKMNQAVKTKACDKGADDSVPGSSTAPASQTKDYSTSITQIKRKEFVPDTVLEQVYNAMRQCELDSIKSIKMGGKILFQHIFTQEEKLECYVSATHGRRPFPSQKVQNMSTLCWLLTNPPVRTLAELNRVKEEPLDSRLFPIFRQSILIEYAYVARTQMKKPKYLSKTRKAKSSQYSTPQISVTATQEFSDELPGSSSVKRSRMISETPPTQILPRAEVNRHSKTPERKQDRSKKENFPTRRSPRKLRDINVY